MPTPKEVQEEVRLVAEADLITFIRLVAPKTVLGSIHEELCTWATRQERKSHQLVLLPRDHQKSRWVAFRVAWHLTKYPWHRILYISSTANLAEKQLKFIKDILSSRIYRRYWPDHLHPEEGKREKWTEGEISLDHPSRKEEGVRDPSVFTAGLTTGITGMHCDVAVLDDIVVKENAYTAEGRNKCASQYSLLASIEGADAEEWAVGTRYHPQDVYNSMLEMVEEEFDDEGEIIGYNNVYETFEREVEDRGDGTGEFMWPRQCREDGRWFGFDMRILARKKAKYLDKSQFYAQYYNNPNVGGNGGIPREKFQYYDRSHLSTTGGQWFYQGERLNIFAAIDFAYSLTKRADYTALVVVGVTAQNNIYVLEIDRFKTEQIKEYFDSILAAYTKWGFRKIRAEITAAQKTIVRDLKDNYIKVNGLALSIDEHSPNKQQGSKEERIKASLQARYDNLQVWHYKGGNCQILEDELINEFPPHDDVKDSLASVIDIAIPPATQASVRRRNNIVYHSRFGGVPHRAVA